MEVEKKIPSSSAAAANSEFTINDLDDDSLGIIFNKLPCIDRIRIESVCKRWRGISEANWCFYSKRLIIDDDMGGFPFQQANSNEKKSANMLEESLQRRGPYIEEIDFTQCDTLNFKTGTIEWIVGLCPKLKCLHLGTLSLNRKDWLAIGSNLEALSFYAFADRYCAELRQLFRTNKRLRRLQVDSHLWCGPSVFDHLDPGQLEFLQISKCRIFALTDGLADKLAESLVEFSYDPCLNDTWYLQNLYKLKNLRSLNLQAESGKLEAALIVDIAENCRKLERLTLAFPWDYQCNESIIAPLFSLPDLRRLVLLVTKNEMPREELDILFRRAPNLKLFVMSTCAQCIYEESGNCHPCGDHKSTYTEAPHFVVWRRK